MKKLFLYSIAFLTLSLTAKGQNISIYSIADARMPAGDQGYTMDGFFMSSSATAKLLEASNFGPSGTYLKSVAVTHAFSNSNDLSAIGNTGGIDLLFFGTFDKNNTSLIPFTPAELDSLYKWSMNGGKMIIGSAASNAPTSNSDFDILDSKWGYNLDYVADANLIPTSAGNSSLIFNGPFGVVDSAQQGGLIRGEFDTIPTSAVILAVNRATNNPTLVLDCETLDLIAADGDAFTLLGNITQGPQINSANDRMWANIIAYMDTLQSQPVISRSGSVLSTGVYSSYQWFKNGTAVAGATSASYTMTTPGIYHVEVNLDCGCNNVSSQDFNVTALNLVETENNLSKFQVFPNPLTENSSVKITLKKSEKVALELYDLNGRKIREIYRGQLKAGAHQFGINPSTLKEGFPLEPGMYILQLQGEQQLASKKLMLL
jgi:hypothetical protein